MHRLSWRLLIPPFLVRTFLSATRQVWFFNLSFFFDLRSLCGTTVNDISGFPHTPTPPPVCISPSLSIPFHRLTQAPLSANTITFYQTFPFSLAEKAVIRPSSGPLFCARKLLREPSLFFPPSLPPSPPQIERPDEAVRLCA